MTTRMRRTSSRRSVRLHPAENGRCTDVVENAKVRMSRYLDTSTEAQMAKIMLQYGRPGCSSRKESVRSPSGRTIMGKATRESSIKIRLSTERTFLVCACGRYKAWLERSRTSIRCGKYSGKTLIWENQYHSWSMLIWVALKENVR